MSSIKVRTAGILIISFSIGIASLTAIVSSLEFLGYSKNIFESLSKSTENTLVTDGYYGDSSIVSDPYAPFTVQHLHPYYLFSLPWRTADRLKINSSIVRLNSDGFRLNPNNSEDFKTTAVLLGGSTAFGHFSSSNQTTIAGTLSELLRMNVINRNAPSWNSHQELVSLAKYSTNYDISISFTLSNDISAACFENNEWEDGDKYLDAPESFVTLASKINDIRGAVVSTTSLKQTIRSIFPDTYRLFGQIKNVYFGSKEELINQNSHASVCPNMDARQVASSFLRNQTAISQLSKARGATHILALQPHIELLITDNPESRFNNSVYDTVIQSQYCKRNLCLDLRNTTFKVTLDDLYDGTNIASALFADRVHLTDKGVSLYSQIIAEAIKGI